MCKKQFLLSLILGAFAMHFAHQLLPHRHCTEVVVAAAHSQGSSHKQAPDHYLPEINQQKDWLDKLLSFVHHGSMDSTLRSSNLVKADFSKVIHFSQSIFNGMPAFRLTEYLEIPPALTAMKHKPQQHVILFKSRLGPPVMA